MMYRRLQHGEILKRIIAHVKQHGTITTTQLREMCEMRAKPACNRLHKLAKSGWLTYKGSATFGIGPRIAGERLSPQEGTDDWLIVQYARDNEGSFDNEDAEIAIDDVRKRAETSLKRLVNGGWLKFNGKRYELAESTYSDNGLKARVDAIVADLRAGVKNFN